jgi:hypothetical protein
MKPKFNSLQIRNTKTKLRSNRGQSSQSSSTTLLKAYKKSSNGLVLNLLMRKILVVRTNSL